MSKPHRHYRSRFMYRWVCPECGSKVGTFWKLKPLDDYAIRNPPSKHQRKLRQLIDMVRVFEATYALKYADPDYVLKHEGGEE